MTKRFEECLAKIKGQQTALQDSDERAVELGVVLPLLGQLGWDTSKIEEFYPQWEISGTGKVDYHLRVIQESAVFIEVKNWKVELKSGDGPEKQLERYCRASKPKPKLAVLTNGRHWWLYLPPRRWHKNAKLADYVFLEFSITDEPKSVERNFKQFMARDAMSSKQAVDTTEGKARQLLEERINDGAVMKSLTDAWNELAADEQTREYVVAKLAERREIQTKESQIKEFLDSRKPSVNEVIEHKGPKRSPKPTSFTFRANGKSPISRPLPKLKGWNELLIIICELMRDYHPDTFDNTLSDMAEWFSKSSDRFKYSNPVGDTGWHVKYGSTEDIKERLKKVVAKFGYPENALTFPEK